MIQMKVVGHEKNLIHIFLLIQIRCWEVQANGATVPKAQQSHNKPILSCCWHAVSNAGNLDLPCGLVVYVDLQNIRTKISFSAPKSSLGHKNF